jgi:hypothetical protein
MWYTWIGTASWHTKYAESDDGTRWRIRENPASSWIRRVGGEGPGLPLGHQGGRCLLMMYGCYWRDDQHHRHRLRVSEDGSPGPSTPTIPSFARSPPTSGNRTSPPATRCCVFPTAASVSGMQRENSPVGYSLLRIGTRTLARPVDPATAPVPEGRSRPALLNLPVCRRLM